MRDLAQWFAWLDQLGVDVIDLGLARIRNVMQKLGLTPSLNAPVIMVAGSNGKGSVIATLEAIYCQAGYRVGAYTSPHLVSFNERIKLQQQPVSDPLLLTAFTAVAAAQEELPLTYFEFTTLASLWIFQQQSLDVILLEVGLGGRLDAVNCINSDVAVITTISLEHQDWLGDTIEEIAKEKAGIIKGRQPVIYGDAAAPLAIQERAKEFAAPLLMPGQGYAYEVHPDSWDWQGQDQTFKQLPLPIVLPSNAAAALAAIEQLKQLTVAEGEIRSGLEQIKLQGRMQWVDAKQKVLLDVAHNPQSINRLVKFLEAHPCSGKKVGLWSMLRDKDHQQVLAQMKPYIDLWLVAPASHPRGATLTELEAALQSQGCVYQSYSSLEDLVLAGKERLEEVERLLVFGSFTVVGAWLKLEFSAMDGIMTL